MAAEFCSVILSALDSSVAGGTAAMELIRQHQYRYILITRSEKGMSMVSNDGDKIDIETDAKEVSDITGAGDTVIAAFGFAMCLGVSVSDAMRFANAAAGIVISKVGTASVSISEILTKHEKFSKS